MRFLPPGLGRVAAALCLLCAATASAMADEAPSGLSLGLELSRETAYPGEIMAVAVTLRVSGATVRNIGYPRIESRGLRIGTFGPPQLTREREGDADVAVYRFSGTAVPTRPTTMTVGPASLTCDVLEAARGSAAFFGGVESRATTVTSPTVTVTVSPLPVSGRPASFSGAIGTFTMAAVGKPDTVPAGEPLTVTTTIKGDGTLAANNCPRLAAGLQGYPVRGVLREGALVCEQVVIPVKAAPLPPVEWGYFDPAAAEYRVLKGSLPVQVVSSTKPGSLPPSVAAVPAVAEKKRPQRLPWRWLAITAATLGIGISLLVKKGLPSPGKAAERGPGARVLDERMAAAEEAALQGDAARFYSALFGTLQEIVAEFCHVPAAAVSSLPARSGLPAHEDIDYLFGRCHSIRYGLATTSQKEMAADLKILRSVFTVIKTV